MAVLKPRIHAFVMRDVSRIVCLLYDTLPLDEKLHADVAVASLLQLQLVVEQPFNSVPLAEAFFHYFVESLRLVSGHEHLQHGHPILLHTLGIVVQNNEYEPKKNEPQRQEVKKVYRRDKVKGDFCDETRL